MTLSRLLRPCWQSGHWKNLKLQISLFYPEALKKVLGGGRGLSLRLEVNYRENLEALQEGVAKGGTAERRELFGFGAQGLIGGDQAGGH